MKPLTFKAFLLVVIACASIAQTAVRTDDGVPAPYPEGFRSWTHVKSALVSSRHPDFERAGGFRHIYANPQAIEGYRSGTFPEGSIIAVDWVEAPNCISRGFFALKILPKFGVPKIVQGGLRLGDSPRKQARSSHLLPRTERG